MPKKFASVVERSGENAITIRMLTTIANTNFSIARPGADITGRLEAIVLSRVKAVKRKSRAAEKKKEPIIYAIKRSETMLIRFRGFWDLFSE